MAKAMKAVIELGGKLDKSLLKSISDTEKQMAALNKGTQAFGKAAGAAVKAAGVAVAAAAGGIAKFAADSIEAGKTFDSSMAQVAATMGTTVDQIGELRDFAQEMGAKTAFSASEAADALNYMALAGYDAETSMAMLPNVLNLAAAGGIDLAYASDMVTDTQSALGLSLDETSQLVDKMAKASSKSNTSVEQLGEALLTVGGTAKNLAGGTTEASTALGILADNGVKGSEGGTALRNVILSLSAPTEKASKAIEGLGLEVFDAEGNMRSLEDIFYDMNESMSDMSQGDQMQTLNEIFNKVDLKSVSALMATSTDRWDELASAIDSAWYTTDSLNDALGESGLNLEEMQSRLEAAGVTGEEFSSALGRSGGDADAFADYLLDSADAGTAFEDVAMALGGDLDKLGEAFSMADGAAQAMADTQLDNLEGDMTIFNSALEGAQIALSDSLTPALRDFVQLGTEGLGGVTKLLKSDGFVEFAQGAVQGLTGAVAGAVESLKAFAEGVASSLDLEGFARALGSVGDAFGGAFGGDSQGAASGFGAVVGGMLNKLVPVIEQWGPLVGNAARAIGAAAEFVMGTVVPAVAEVAAAVMPTLTQIVGAIMEAMPSIMSIVGTVMGAIKGVFEAVWPAVSGIVTTAVGAISGAIQGISAIVGGVKATFDAIGRAITDPIGTARDTISKIVEAIKGFFSNFKIELPKIKLPHFAVKPEGWQIGDLLQGKIPTLGIEWYAKGGFTRGPVAIAGEAGPEAVISFDPRYRSDNIAYWMQAGKMLGVLRAFAAGGFPTGEASPVAVDLASPTGALAVAAGNAGAVGSTVHMGGVTFAPQVSVSGEGAGDIASQIRAQRDEFFDAFEELLAEKGFVNGFAY